MTENFDNDVYTGHLNYLYSRVNQKYRDAPDKDTLVQECLLALYIAEKKYKVENHKAFLNSVLKNKYNDSLREKYRNSIILYEFPEALSDPAEEDNTEQYEIVRKEIGRLIRIYREVTILYYMKKLSVEQIAKKLNIPKGTVLSRLASARKQVKEGIENMEKYSEISYDPKHLEVGIWGGPSLSGAPFSLIPSLIEENILILAYPKPISVKSIADTIGIPCAYIEPIIASLIDGELMGESLGGLVYTRCFIQSYRQSLGDIDAQEVLSNKYAKNIWDTVSSFFLPLLKEKPYISMTDKQKAAFLLFALHNILTELTKRITKDDSLPSMPPERKNAGRWIAYGTYFERYEQKIEKYVRSGPACFQYADNTGECICKMFDFQSVFGDTHYAYRSLKYNCTPQSILRFYASFVNKDIQTDNYLLYELCEDFQKLNIVRINEDGKHILDIPVLSFSEWEQMKDLCSRASLCLEGSLQKELTAIWSAHNNKVPLHVDMPELYTHRGGLGIYTIAQMLAIVGQGLMPYNVEIGKTPLILLLCERKEEQ